MDPWGRNNIKHEHSVLMSQIPTLSIVDGRIPAMILDALARLARLAKNKLGEGVINTCYVQFLICISGPSGITCQKSWPRRVYFFMKGPVLCLNNSTGGSCLRFEL